MLLSNIHSMFKNSEQGSANFSYRGPDSKYICFCRSDSLCGKYSVLLWWSRRSHRQNITQWVWRGANKTLFTTTGGWLVYTFFFFFKNWYEIYILQSVKSHNSRDQSWFQKGFAMDWTSQLYMILLLTFLHLYESSSYRSTS